MATKLSNKDKDFFLVQKALCGEQSAYNKIFSKYRSTLVYQISNIIEETDLVEDIMMETFEKAFERLPKFQPDYQLSAWLSRIAVNCAIDYTRKKSRVSIKRIDEDYDDEDKPTTQIIDNDYTPEELFAKEQRIIFVKEAMNMLPNNYRKVLQLRFFEEFSYEEIADELGCSVSLVKGYIHRARKDLVNIIHRIAPKDIQVYL